MRQLTPQEREALMADMRSFFKEDSVDETLGEDEVVARGAGSDAGHKNGQKCGWELSKLSASHK